MVKSILMLLLLLLSVFLIFYVIRAIFSKIFTSNTVYEYERAVKFHNGQFREVVGPGKYTYLNSTTRLEVFDLRPSILQLNGQELLSADNVSVKISLAVKYQIIDPKILISQYENYYDYLYTTIQLKLREFVSTLELDQVLNSRKEINDRVRELVVTEESLVGLVVQSVEVKDIMLSSEVRKIYSEITKAKKEAQASLEKARGEMATLRSLANAAKMLEKNPELVKLRMIQTIEASQGNTFIIDTNPSVSEAAGEKK